jgi:hypothetical protein
MSRTVYVNGQWLPEHEARVSVFDRGFLFADAIYEVTAVVGGKLIDYAGHSNRLKRSLASLAIPLPVSEEDLLALHREIVLRNAMKEGLIYLQVSRGEQDRDFLFSNDLTPTFVMFTQARKVLNNPKWAAGISVVTMPEGRWEQRQIKTVQLLYSSLAKMQAQKQGADDAILRREWNYHRGKFVERPYRHQDRNAGDTRTFQCSPARHYPRIDHRSGKTIGSFGGRARFHYAGGAERCRSLDHLGHEFCNAGRQGGRSPNPGWQTWARFATPVASLYRKSPGNRHLSQTRRSRRSTDRTDYRDHVALCGGSSVDRAAELIARHFPASS